MSTQPLGNGFAQGAANAWEDIHRPRPCDRCAKVKPCEDFATPRICDTCIADHVEDQDRTIRNLRAKLRNCKKWAEHAYALRGSKEPSADQMRQLWLWIAQIAHEAIPHTQASPEIDERFERR